MNPQRRHFPGRTPAPAPRPTPSSSARDPIEHLGFFAKGGNPHSYDSLYTSKPGRVDRAAAVVLPAHLTTPGLLRQQRTGLFATECKDMNRQGHRPHADHTSGCPGRHHVQQLRRTPSFVDNMPGPAIITETKAAQWAPGRFPPLPGTGQKHGRRWKYRRRSRQQADPGRS